MSLPTPPAAPPPGSPGTQPTAPGPAADDRPIEDAGTQALAEALRSSFQIVRFLMVVLVVVFFTSGVFTVNPNEIAIVLRFGRPAGDGADQLLKPGLHWAFPYPIDEVVRIPVGQSHTAVSTVGWYIEESPGTPPTPMGYLRPGVDGYTLTGDGNIIHARATLKYRIRPEAAARYAFTYSSTTNLVQDILDNALLHAAATTTAEGALYRDKLAFSDAVRARVANRIEDLQLGILVETDDVTTAAPADVKQAFDEVLTAQQTARTRISEAESYARGITNNALGQFSALVSDSLTASNQFVKTIAAEAGRFQDQLPYYRENAELFRKRLWTESMSRVLTNAQFKVFVPARADGGTRTLQLQMNRGAEKPAAKDAQP